MIGSEASISFLEDKIQKVFFIEPALDSRIFKHEKPTFLY